MRVGEKNMQGGDVTMVDKGQQCHEGFQSSPLFSVVRVVLLTRGAYEVREVFPEILLV